jgi:hypothetical protein
MMLKLRRDLPKDGELAMKKMTGFNMVMPLFQQMGQKRRKQIRQRSKQGRNKMLKRQRRETMRWTLVFKHWEERMMSL